MSTNTLPKDVGLCEQCSARNSRHAKTCNQCASPLPWAKPAAPPAMPSVGRAGAAPTSPSPQAQARPTQAPARIKPQIPDVGGALSSVDWGASLIAGLLAILVFVASCACLPVGIGLYWYFKQEDNWLRHPAAAALWLAALGFLVRFMAIGIMGVEAVNN